MVSWCFQVRSLPDISFFLSLFPLISFIHIIVELLCVFLPHNKWYFLFNDVLTSKNKLYLFCVQSFLGWPLNQILIIAVIEEMPLGICVHDQIQYFKIKKIKQRYHTEAHSFFSDLVCPCQIYGKRWQFKQIWPFISNQTIKYAYRGKRRDRKSNFELLGENIWKEAVGCCLKIQSLPAAGDYQKLCHCLPWSSLWYDSKYSNSELWLV